MKPITIYTVLAVLGKAAAAGGDVVELTGPSASLLAFLATLFAMPWLAWVLTALRLTRE